MGTINNISVLSTGQVQIRPQHVESDGSSMTEWLSTATTWTAPRPINVYVIEHSDGLVLFDTGQDRSSVTDPDYFPGGPAGEVYDRLARFEIPADQTLTAQLARLGHDIADVKVAILSHLHQDHIGGLRELPHAEIIVSQQDWDELDRPDAAFIGLLKQHIDIPALHWNRVTPTPVDDPTLAPFTNAYDVMNDGTLLLLPTPGHTPGSLSLLLRKPQAAPLLFVGDLTYDVNLLAQDRIPGVGDTTGLHTSTRHVNEFATRNPGLTILAAHDPAAAHLLNTALDRTQSTV
ncbi:N-acyl homoserine lactonase family protein [Streptomyces sp. NBC_01198]|uniref:N-acyl homoserine lactonase family protein n=1 Tax=Streptomyces sp. NBC_01198 TaxID=2903769 RepID=UPI002E10027E|nr:N-acyl homoserine lactonase family protein [Streptomyces sp. NBC_01198]WSR61317.1 N-acyl homoserine lactonase family protein [Streptomyces sp. NBC_01198]